MSILRCFGHLIRVQEDQQSAGKSSNRAYQGRCSVCYCFVGMGFTETIRFPDYEIFTSCRM